MHKSLCNSILSILYAFLRLSTKRSCSCNYEISFTGAEAERAADPILALAAALARSPLRVMVLMATQLPE